MKCKKYNWIFRELTQQRKYVGKSTCYIFSNYLSFKIVSRKIVQL